MTTLSSLHLAKPAVTSRIAIEGTSLAKHLRLACSYASRGKEYKMKCAFLTPWNREWHDKDYYEQLTHLQIEGMTVHRLPTLPNLVRLQVLSGHIIHFGFMPRVRHLILHAPEGSKRALGRVLPNLPSLVHLELWNWRIDKFGCLPRCTSATLVSSLKGANLPSLPRLRNLSLVDFSLRSLPEMLRLVDLRLANGYVESLGYMPLLHTFFADDVLHPEHEKSDKEISVPLLPGLRSYTVTEADTSLPADTLSALLGYWMERASLGEFDVGLDVAPRLIAVVS